MNDDLVIDILKMNSLSVTPARVVLIQFLHAKKQAFVSLKEIIKTTPAHINRTTLYRTLLSFCTADLLYKIVDNRNKVFYGISERLKPHITINGLTNKNNYHFQCHSCGNIFCLPIRMPVIELPAGFKKTDSHLLLSGECDRCSTRKTKYHVK